MKNLLFTLAFLLFSSSILFSQKNRYVITLEMEKGGTEEAMIEVNDQYPWRIQKNISVFDQSLKDEKKIKRKQKKSYKAKELKGFEFDGRKFITKKVIVAAGTYGGTLKGLPNYTFLEVIADGDISVYRAYSYPPGAASGVTFDEIYADIRSNPNYFVIKHKDKKAKLRDIGNINIEKLISDAPGVSEKFKNGDYGNFKRKEGKKMMNFIKGQVENENPALIVDIIREYNKEVGQ